MGQLTQTLSRAFYKVRFCGYPPSLSYATPLVFRVQLLVLHKDVSTHSSNKWQI